VHHSGKASGSYVLRQSFSISWISRPAVATALLLLTCAGGAVPAAARQLGPGTRPFSACNRIQDANKLDALRRPGIGAIRCRVGPNLQFAILSDDTVSWPVIIVDRGPSVSLEDPLAKRAWFPNTSSVRVRPERDLFLPIRKRADAVTALVYSAFASRTDGPGSVNLFVSLRIRPTFCLLGVTPALGGQYGSPANPAPRASHQ
jgi:hypothetical protein